MPDWNRSDRGTSMMSVNMSVAITWLMTLVFGLGMPAWCCCRSIVTGSMTQNGLTSEVFGESATGGEHACCGGAMADADEGQSKTPASSLPMNKSCPMDQCPSLQGVSYNLAKTNWSLPPAVELPTFAVMPVISGHQLLIVSTQITMPRSFDRPPPLILAQSPVASHRLMTI